MCARDADEPGPDASRAVPSGWPESEDQRYFREIEETFVALRGAPMLLTPQDWQTARSWRLRGIPLGLVRESLVEVFQRRAERGSQRRVSSLRYCAPAVEKAWSEQLELGTIGAPEAVPRIPTTLDVERRLRRLADALPAALPDRESWRERVTGLARSGDAEEVERQLAELDERLVSSLVATLSGRERRLFEEQVAGALTAVSSRLGEQGARRAARALVAKQVRTRFDLPVLSLFGS